MRKLTLLIMFLSFAAVAAHTHLWSKQSTYEAEDSFGNVVVVCNWVCNMDPMNTHYATTSGPGYCPQPMN